MRKPKVKTEGPAAKWGKRIEQANKLWDEWNKDYQGDNNEKYYLGHQHLQPTDAAGRMKYVINLCFPSVEIKMAAQLFSKPRITVIPRPGIEDDPNTNWDALAKMLRDMVLTCITIEDSGFSEEIPLSLQETFYRYGVIEVGLSTNPVENPNARPLDVPIPGDSEAEDTKIAPVAAAPAVEGAEAAETAVQPEPVLSQMVYYKRIPAAQFRVSANSRPQMRSADWVGYFEYLNCEDVKECPAFDPAARNELESTHSMKSSPEDRTDTDKKHEGMLKVWTVYDNRTRMKYTFADGKDKYLQEEPFEYIPLAMLSMHPIMDSPYPLPPMFNWLSPQDELNETREMQRVHRRRGTRKYLARRAALSSEDKDKLRSSEDGVLLEVEDIHNTIAPMLDAPLDRAVAVNVPLTKDDFRNISGVSGEATGESDSPTATQANIVNVNAVSRDNYYKYKIAKWLARIFKLTVMVLRKEAALPIWVKSNVDVDSPMAMQEAALTFEAWKKINAEELGSVDFDIHVSIDSLSDQGMTKERQDWITFLGTVFGEDAQTALAMSPELLKKTMELYGIRNGKEIQAIGDVMAQISAMKMQMAGMEAGSKAGAGGDPGAGPAGGQNTRTPVPGPNPQAQNDAQIDKRR